VRSWNAGCSFEGEHGSYQDERIVMKRITCELLAATRFSLFNEIIRLVLVAVAVMVLVTSEGYSQEVKTHDDDAHPVFRVDVWGRSMSEFNNRVWSYFELRSALEKGLPPRRVTDDPAEIRRAVHALANSIRVAREEAKQGDIFTPTISAEFRKSLLLEMNASTWASIMDDNPGEFSVEVNGCYPDEKPLSTVPPTDDIQYRFLGRHLILYDARASLVLDRIPYAIRCGDRELSCRQ
jgi:hypothetical protein